MHSHKKLKTDCWLALIKGKVINIYVMLRPKKQQDSKRTFSATVDLWYSALNQYFKNVRI